MNNKYYLLIIKNINENSNTLYFQSK